MSDRLFFDTNILVYSRDASEPEKQRIAFKKLLDSWDNHNGCLSAQVLNEYYVTVTQKLRPGLSRNEAWQDIVAFEAWDPVPIDMKCINTAHEVQSAHQTSWWDSLIISAAYISGSNVILSEDLSHGKGYFGIEICNPFIG